MCFACVLEIGYPGYIRASYKGFKWFVCLVNLLGPANMWPGQPLSNLFCRLSGSLSWIPSLLCLLLLRLGIDSSSQKGEVAAAAVWRSGRPALWLRRSGRQVAEASLPPTLTFGRPSRHPVKSRCWESRVSAVSFWVGMVSIGCPSLSLNTALTNLAITKCVGAVMALRSGTFVRRQHRRTYWPSARWC